jgi:hypothetical protein
MNSATYVLQTWYIDIDLPHNDSNSFTASHRNDHRLAPNTSGLTCVSGDEQGERINVVNKQFGIELTGDAHFSVSLLARALQIAVDVGYIRKCSRKCCSHIHCYSLI